MSDGVILATWGKIGAHVYIGPHNRRCLDRLRLQHPGRRPNRRYTIAFSSPVRVVKSRRVELKYSAPLPKVDDTAIGPARG
jgi:hypothetical protein